MIGQRIDSALMPFRQCLTTFIGYVAWLCFLQDTDGNDHARAHRVFIIYKRGELAELHPTRIHLS
jgi:hypothetical protein